MLQRDTVTPCPGLKSPTSATVISFAPSVVVAVVSNFDPDAPKSVTLTQPFAAAGGGAGSWANEQVDANMRADTIPSRGMASVMNVPFRFPTPPVTFAAFGCPWSAGKAALNRPVASDGTRAS